MIYNYREAVIEDVKEYIEDNKEYLKERCKNEEDLKDYLNEELWIDDSITGNASGSYTFNSYEAHNNLFGNEDLINEVKQEWGIDEARAYDWEYLDVSIRCYLLGECIDQALEEINIFEDIDIFEY